MRSKLSGCPARRSRLDDVRASRPRLGAQLLTGRNAAGLPSPRVSARLRPLRHSRSRRGRGDTPVSARKRKRRPPTAALESRSTRTPRAGIYASHPCAQSHTRRDALAVRCAHIVIDTQGETMSLPAAITVIVALDLALVGFLAWMMSHPRHLSPHRSTRYKSSVEPDVMQLVE